MSQSLPLATPGDDCWRQIGIGGDRSCPELETYIHCRSCPVYASAARTFFDRPAPEGYLAEWTRLLSREKAVVDVDSQSVLVFRLLEEWLALSTRILSEVTHPRPVHRIPHRDQETLLGLVNIRGQLQLCVSMHRLLGVSAASPAAAEDPVAAEARLILPRLVVVEWKAKRWAFPAEEVRGVSRISRAGLRAVPSTLTKVSSCSQAVFTWHGHSVGLLDDQRVLSALRSIGQ